MAPSPAPRWLLGVFAALFVLAGGSIAAWSVELPYYAFSPGPVGDAVDVVLVDEGVRVYQPDGELLMLTVSAQELNLYEVVAAAVDPSADLVRRELLRRQDESDEEYRNRQLDMMDQSIQTAITVALSRAGVDLGPPSYRVVEVLGAYPAAEFLEPGDLLVEVDGVVIANADDPRRALSDNAPGDVVEVVVDRDGEVLSFRIELGSASDEESRAVIGIGVALYLADPPIDIDAGNIGGPSAGMMYTLAIVDLLGEEQLTRGHVIAGTGTINGDGSVGGIGGVRQKVVAAEAAGAEVMLVPESNYQEALTAPRREMALVPVATIDDALAALAELEPA